MAETIVMVEAATPVAGDSLDRLLQLVDEHCTSRTITKLLQEAKARDKDIRVSGNKTSILQNLRDGISRGTIPQADVYQMLCAAEENGNQHVFYYEPVDSSLIAKYNDGDAVATALFGAGWQAAMKFPQLYLDDIGVKWSDFRIAPTAGGHLTWTGKIYSGKDRPKFLRQEDREHGEFARIYKYEFVREIYLVKWHSFGLLELRVPRRESKADVISAVQQDLWPSIASAVSPDDFREWDLSIARRRLKNEHEQHKSLYERGNIRAQSSGLGGAYFTVAHGDDELGSDPEHAQAVQLYQDVIELVINWLPQQQTDAIEASLRTVIGKVANNEVLIAAKATADAVNYVTYRLREFSKRDTVV
jgi:hypothetical protein